MLMKNDHSRAPIKILIDKPEPELPSEAAERSALPRSPPTIKKGGDDIVVGGASGGGGRELAVTYAAWNCSVCDGFCGILDEVLVIAFNPFPVSNQRRSLSLSQKCITCMSCSALQT
jgi:hypothetical protein